MRTLAIEGLDGSGKSRIARELAASYEHEGLSAQIVSPYRLANARLGHDLYPLWKSTNGGLLAISALHAVIQEKTKEAKEAETDVLIFDRHWMTAFSEIAANDELVAAWGDTFVPTAYLRVDPSTARLRAANDKDEAWMQKHNYDNYAARYERLCQTNGGHLLNIYRNDNDVSTDSIVKSIVWDMNIRR